SRQRQHPVTTAATTSTAIADPGGLCGTRCEQDRQGLAALWLAADAAVRGQAPVVVPHAGSWPPAVQLHEPRLDHLQATEEALDLLVSPRRRPGTAHARAQLPQGRRHLLVNVAGR